MSRSRTENTTRTIMAGLLRQVISIFLPFVNRTIIIHLLGAEFAGLSGLFTSILSVLSLAELGFGSAAVYCLYKPIAEHNTERICELLALYRRIYLIIGCVVLGIGLCVMPFVPRLIHGSHPETVNLYLLYSLFLATSVISYFFFAYKEALLIADQRKDILEYIRAGVSVAQFIGQCAVLLILKNYYIYLLIAVICAVASNIILQIVSSRKYPNYIPIKNRGIKIPEELKKQISALFINRICDTCRNSFDSLIISAMLGLVATTIYGNYYYVFFALYAVMLVITNSLGPSVGNSIAQESQEKNYSDLLTFTYIFAWISGWCTVCLFCLYQPFMQIWVGSELTLPFYEMLLFCIYFYVINMNNIRNEYVNGSALWWNMKTSYIVEAIANLILNVILGRYFGMAGILWATIITIVFSNYLWRTAILFRHYFKGQSLPRLLGDQIYYLLITILASGVTYYLCSLVNTSDWLKLLISGIICIFVPNIIFLCGFAPRKYFKPSIMFMMQILRKRI